MSIRLPAFPPPLNASANLPDELIIEILSRLNVKSLMAMKCVCKSWNTLISDPIFVKMHLNLSKRNSHLAVLSIKNTAVVTSVTRLLESTSISIDYYPFNGHFKFEGIVGSCNGLICLHRYNCEFWYQDCDFRYQRHCFYFCNPATRTKSETFVSLPRRQTIWFGFGYDNSSDSYKAVVLGFNSDGFNLRKHVRTTATVFTLGDNTWRYIQSFFPVEVALSSLDEVKYDGVYLSNSISWLLQNNKFLIISLDLGTETYTQMLLPSCCCDELLPLDNPTLSVLMDSLCFSHDFKATHLVIWQMKEFGVEESWTQFLKISYMNLGIKYELSLRYDFQVLPLCLSEIDATLILAIKPRNQTIIYNWRDNSVKKIEKANGISWCTAKDYVESLVSTC